MANFNYDNLKISCTSQLGKVNEIVPIKLNGEAIEIGFNNKEKCIKFFDAISEYSIALQQNEDKFILQYIGESVKYIIDKKLIKYEDLYILSEEEIINIIKDNVESWILFTSSNNLIRTDIKPASVYYVSVDVKKRIVIPLCNVDGSNIRLDKISEKVLNKINEYNNFNDSKYCYVNNILPFN